MVHIRFWKMARTFTGLKLQGEMGKFGTVEISDISGALAATHWPPRPRALLSRRP